MFKIEVYRDPFFTGVKELWELTYPEDPPWNRAEVVIPAKVATQPELFVVAVDPEGSVLGAALAGYDGHRGWLYSAAVAPAHRRIGIGSTLVRNLERRLQQLGCFKINLQVLSLDTVLLGFYHSLGYRTEDRVSMGRRLLADHRAAAVRPVPSEKDAVPARHNANISPRR